MKSSAKRFKRIGILNPTSRLQVGFLLDSIGLQVIAAIDRQHRTADE
jgi:hypothetical protein